MDQKLITLLEEGFAQQKKGNFFAAEKNYLHVLKKDADNQFALNLLGVVSIHNKDFEQAIKYLEKALTVNADDADTYSNLGLAFKEIKRLPDAQKMFEKALSFNAKHPINLNNLGNVFASLNEHEKAIYCFDCALRIDGQYIDCLHNMFISLKEQHQFDKALHSVEHILKLDPSNSRAHNNKGEIFKLKIQYQKAQACFEKAIEIDNDIVAKINLASVLKLLNKELKARALLEEVLAIEPENAEANNHLGVLHEQLGDFEQAAKYFRLAIKHEPCHASAYYQLSKLKNQRLSESEISKIKALLEQENILDILKSPLSLALAWEFDKQKDFDKSMTYFIKGKKIKANQYPYDKNIMEQYLAFCQQLFPLKSPENHLVEKKLQPIFVVGMPRSGTTLTEQILASHSKVYGAGEVGYINEISQQAEQLTKSKYPACTAQLSAAQIETLRDSYLDKIKERSGEASYFVDKNPLNYHSIGFIKQVFPEAKFIYCKREAMDNCISIFKLPFDSNQTYSHDLKALGLYYQQHEKLMAFWQQCYSNDIFLNQYEKTVADIDSQAQGLLSFLGLDFEQGVLEFYDNKRIVLTPSAEQVRQPIYNSSVGAWKRYRKYLSPLYELVGTGN